MHCSSSPHGSTVTRPLHAVPAHTSDTVAWQSSSLRHTAASIAADPLHLWPSAHSGSSITVRPAGLLPTCSVTTAWNSEGDGTAVGSGVGAGSAVGSCVGSAVGASVGVGCGVAVGSGVGVGVGLGVGAEQPL